MIFIGVVSVVIDDKVCLAVASDGRKIVNRHGLPVRECLDFYHSLKAKRGKESVTVVTYASARESEFLFSSLSPALKDKLFKSYGYRTMVEGLESENERLFEELSMPDVTAERVNENKALIDINKIVLQDLNTVEAFGYRISVALGKKLSLRKLKQNHVVNVFDLHNFFGKPLREAYSEWTGLDVPMLDRQEWEMMRINRSADTAMLELVMEKEAQAIAELAKRLSDKLAEGGIRLRNYHGATAVTSALLSRSKAKDEYHNYAYRRQYPPILWQAVNTSFFGGRIEQVKLGTLPDVNVYDINSAYASASTLLPRLLKLPEHTSRFEDNPFSIWYVRWEDPECYLPTLPVRSVTGRITYPVRGSGYYWYPEVAQAMRVMRNVEVLHGFVFDYQPAKFTESIADLYRFRQKLRAEGHPLEKVIKLALASLYGKFCQTQGKANYYNLFYAGFITAVTRARMARAVEGKEHATICFLTDAIHTMAELDVELSDEMGAFSLKRYDSGTYCDIGVYGLQKEGVLVKTATMGYADSDFDGMRNEFSERLKYTGKLDVFVGHNLHTLAPLKFGRYLELAREEKENSPVEQGARCFVGLEGVDLLSDWVDSEPRAGIPTDSKFYHPRHRLDIAVAKEMARAKR